MGISVKFASSSMLLQREDFPAALRAVHKIAKNVPGFFRAAAAVSAAKELRAALALGDFPIALDANGDAVKMV